jgi:hypothetical protein
MLMTVAMLDAIAKAELLVFATPEVKTKDVSAMECAEVVLLVMFIRGFRMTAELVFSIVPKLNRVRTEVPPTANPIAFPSTVKSTLSNSTSPTFVVMTVATEAAFV